MACHRCRKNLIWKEMFTSILLNFGFNLLFLSPNIILGVYLSKFQELRSQIITHFFLTAINVFERQNILVDSIGAFPEEFAAFEQAKLMLIIGFVFLVFFTIGQVVLYYLYNGEYHPYCKIVKPDAKCKYFLNNQSMI